MKQELLLCPFCGAEPSVSDYARDWYGCPNANCPASVVSTSAITWNTRAPDARVQPLAGAAQAVLDRWNTPLWKDAEPTATVMNRLRDALAEAGFGEVGNG